MVKEKKKMPKEEPKVVNAAPGYDPYTRHDQGASDSYGAPPANGAAPTAPPVQGPKNPFVNAMFLYQFGKPIKATIKGVRDATGIGNVQYQRPGVAPRKGWFLDCVLENGQACTARINEGDSRHQKLWAAFGAQWAGQTVILRLSNPADKTKAPWTVSIPEKF
jgi:hypothetical protein